MQAVLQLQAYYDFLATENPPATSEAISRIWMGMTCDDFDVYRVTHRYRGSSTQVRGDDQSDTNSDITSIRNDHNDQHLAEDFRRGNKRQLSDYPAFKEDKNYLKWERETRTQLTIHGASEIANENFDVTLLSDAQKEEYKVKTAFVYRAFESTFNTSRSKMILRTHSATMDARLVFQDMVNWYRHSGIAEEYAQKAYQVMMSLSFDQNWKNGAKAFLVKWSNLLLDYQDIKDTTVTPPTKYELLSNSLRPNNEMFSAITSWKTTAKLIAIQSSGQFSRTSATTQITEKQYMELWIHLEESAITYDGSHKIRNSSRTAKTAEAEGKKIHENFKKGFIPMKVFKKMPENLKKIHLEATKQQREKYKKEKEKEKEKSKDSNQRKANVSEIKPAEDEFVMIAQTANNTGVASQPTVVNTAEKSYTIQGLFANKAKKETDEAYKSPLSLLSESSNAKQVYTTESGEKYIRINVAKKFYTVTAHSMEATKPDRGALIDRGANGGLAGPDDMLFREHDVIETCDVKGIGDEPLTALKIVTGASLINTTKGPIIGIFPQYAALEKGSSIHSSRQMENWGIDVDEKSRKLPTNPGKQRLVTPEGHVIPVKIRNGLPYIDMRKPDDDEFERYPHVFFTSDAQWDPTELDDEYDVSDMEDCSIGSVQEGVYDLDNENWNQFGEFVDRQAYNFVVDDDVINSTMDEIMFTEFVDECLQVANKIESRREVNYKVRDRWKPKFELLRPNFGYISADRIKSTLAATMHMARAVYDGPFRKHYKSRFPAYNVNRLAMKAFTDTFFADVASENLV